MKLKLVRCLQNDQKASLDSVRLWKCNFSCNTRDKLSEYFKTHKVSAEEIEFGHSDPEAEIELNSGVSFPGQ